MTTETALSLKEILRHSVAVNTELHLYSENQQYALELAGQVKHVVDLAFTFVEAKVPALVEEAMEPAIPEDDS